MEKKCTLSNEELVAICEKWVFKLAESGGKDWMLSVPVNFNKDPDVLFIELAERLKAASPQGIKWVKASTWPEGRHNDVHWRGVSDKRPLLVIGRNYQENIIAQFGKVYTPEELEWLDEGQSQGGEDKPKYYSDQELRDIISEVCDQLNEDINGREEFIDQTIAVFAEKKAAIDELRKQGVKHPNPHLCDNRQNCGYPGCECLPF